MSAADLERAKRRALEALAAERGSSPDDPAVVAEADRLGELYVAWYCRRRPSITVQARFERYALLHKERGRRAAE